MQDWNMDGHIDAADMATEYAAYTDTMNSKPRQSTPGSSTGSRAGGAAWAIIAAAVLALLALCSH